MYLMVYYFDLLLCVWVPVFRNLHALKFCCLLGFYQNFPVEGVGYGIGKRRFLFFFFFEILSNKISRKTFKSIVEDVKVCISPIQ